ncbi:MAG: acetyl-CoA carboxylase, biotin carboxyl carrier protein [Chloroflexota bacterium]|nr:acetyl-CoA carboxylase, biotin carboxyl carrier protein [Chloroflexota bacterium]
MTQDPAHSYLSYRDVLDILQIIDQSQGCRELQLELGDVKLAVVRAAGGASPDASSPVNAQGRHTGFGEGLLKGEAQSWQAGAAEPASATATAARPASAPEGGGSAAAVSVGVKLTSPVLGTFYRAPAPGERPFVEVGRRVQQDDVVCIVDVMKMMNMVRAGTAGVVREICAENEQVVEYGQVLMVIDPD